MSAPRTRFTTEVDPDLLDAMRRIAKEEGLQFQTLVDEAFADLLEKRRQGRARSHVMAAYQASHGAHASLYEKLAK